MNSELDYKAGSNFHIVLSFGLVVVDTFRHTDGTL